MKEHDALTVLDRRMIEASAQLRRAVDEALGDSPSAAAGAVAAGSERGGHEPSPAIRLERSTVPSRSPRHLVWAAAAAVIAIAGVAGLVIVARGKDKSTPPTSTVVQPFLVPGWLPSGWGPKSAVRGAASSEQPPTATVYGSSSAEDPWTGDEVIVVRVDSGGTTTPSDPATVDVSGHSGTTARDGDTLIVTVPVGDRTFTISGRGVSTDALVRVAAAAVDGQLIESALPPGLVELADGSLDASGPPPEGGLSLVFGADSSAHSVTITQRPGRVREVGLVRLVLPAPNTMTRVSVHDHPGVLIASTAGPDSAGSPSVVQWLEAPDLLVTVWSEGVGDEELMRLVEAMKPATDAEIDKLVGAYPEPSVVSDGVQAGEVVVAAGDRGANHWRVTAREDGGSLDVSYEDDSSGFGFGVASGPDPAPALEVSTSDSSDARGERVMIGVADPAIARVVVDAAGQPPLPVELYRHDQLTRAVIVGFVTRPYDHGEVVGFDATGHEVARTSLDQ